MDSRRPDDVNIDVGQEATDAVSEGDAVPGAVTEGGAATTAAKGVAEGGAATTASATEGVAQEASGATEQVAEGATGVAGKVVSKFFGIPAWLMAVAGLLLLLILLRLVFGRRGARG